MHDNVFILGAGASYDAGIPLLSDFVQRMWEIALRGKINDYNLSNEDILIFKNAIKVRDELDQYHGRASFDDRNIEDILSILTFNLYGKNQVDKNRLSWIIKAIERTIEISCNVQFDEKYPKIKKTDNSIYMEFWMNIFKWAKNSNLVPTIITLNYDLVLERSLLQFLSRDLLHDSSNFERRINIKYYYKHLSELSYLVTNKKEPNQFGQMVSTLHCNSVDEHLVDGVDVEILKLHGSLNFPTEKNKDTFATIVQDKPLILPPVFNKGTSINTDPIWNHALDCLRSVKNLIFVGYSLPKTDIYLQYFFKAGLGPNNNLNNIFIFDPIFKTKSENNDFMKQRYKDCFSQQMHNRIHFMPSESTDNNVSGKFSSFVEKLGNSPDMYLF